MSLSGNNSTVYFGTNEVTSVRSIDFPNTPAEIDCGSLKGAKLYEAGATDAALDIECLGTNAIVIGQTGSISIAWGSGATDTATKYVCTGVSRNTSVDSPVVTRLRFRPSTT
jgi:hypothetical protein